MMEEQIGVQMVEKLYLDRIDQVTMTFGNYYSWKLIYLAFFYYYYDARY